MGFLLNQYEITLSFLTSLDLKFILLDIGTITPGCFMDFCWLQYYFPSFSPKVVSAFCGFFLKGSKTEDSCPLSQSTCLCPLIGEFITFTVIIEMYWYLPLDCFCFKIVACFFTGPDTKLMQNSGKTKFKRTSIDRLMNTLVLWVSFSQVVEQPLCCELRGWGTF